MSDPTMDDELEWTLYGDPAFDDVTYPTAMYSPGDRFTLARTGETIQLVRPARGDGAWLASVMFPYSTQRDLITCPAEWIEVLS